MLSEFSFQMKQKLEQPSDHTKKLLLTLEDKNSYVIHIRLLQLAIRLGAQVTKVHRVLSFDQEAWLKDYVDLCTTERRKYKKGSFQDMSYKLMVNALYGKMLENVRNYKDAKLYEKLPDLKKMRAYHQDFIFNENLALVEFDKKQVLLNKPIIVGQTILDISKCLMYEFFYKLKERYPDLNLLMTDTDSLMLDLPVQFNEDLKTDEQLRNLFDLSVYKKDDPIFTNVTNAEELQNKTRYIPGLMKDETAGDEIVEFVGLSSKVYRFITKKEKEKVCAKGVKRSKFNSPELSMRAFKSILFSSTKNEVTFEAMRSEKHEVFWKTISKVGLSAYDNKFFYINEIDSLPYGHRNIKQLRKESDGKRT